MQTKSAHSIFCCNAILDCSSHVGSAATSFKNLVTVTPENPTNQTADVLVEDQLRPPGLGEPLPRSKNCTNQIVELSVGYLFLYCTHLHEMLMTFTNFHVLLNWNIISRYKSLIDLYSICVGGRNEMIERWIQDP